MARPTPTRRLLVAAALVSVALAACSSDSDASGTTTTTGASLGDGTILAVGFTLSDVTVAPGADLELLNQDGTEHTATADDGSFALRAPGGVTEGPVAAPSQPGTYPFHCEIHSTMTATLTVVE